MKIDEYLAEIRKWPRRPNDYDSTTENIIRRWLNPGTPLADISAEIERGQVETAYPASQSTPEPAANASLSASDDKWMSVDAQANYQFALELMRKK